MPYTNDWSDSTPIDHLAFDNIPSSMRQIRIDIEQRLAAILYGFTSGETLQGIKVMPANSQATDPGAVSGQIQVYAKTVSGNVEFFLQDSSGNIIQLTKGGKINGAFFGNLAAILVAAGIIPQLNISKLDSNGNLVDGSALTGLANTLVGAGLLPKANVGSLGGTRISRSANNAYQAATDGLVQLNIDVGGNNTTFPSNASIYVDTNNPPTSGTRWIIGPDGDGTAHLGGFYCASIYVQKNEYYEVTTQGAVNVLQYQFVPIAS